MHHLDINVTKWLNIGLFEGIIFGREDHFEFSYLNPIFFIVRLNSRTEAMIILLSGLDFKANVAQRFQFYGQLLLDEFKLIRGKSRQWLVGK